MKHILLLSSLLFATIVTAGDWPQWRGPARNGIAVGEPSPTATWGANGPPEVWRVPIFRAKDDGGLGNPVVADGRVFLFLSPQSETDLPTRSFTESALRATGWFPEKIPDDILAKVEAVRLSEELKNLKGADRNAWIRKWMEANLSAEQDQRFGWILRERLRKGAEEFPLETLAKLNQLKGKTFESQAALDEWLAAQSLTGQVAVAVNKAAVKVLKHQADLILGFDARTGKELWRHEYPGMHLAYGLSGTPAVADGRVYIVSSTGDAYCFAVEDGKELWKQPLGRGSSGSFLVANGLAIVPAASLTALDPVTGAVKWRASKVTTTTNSPMLWRSADKSYLLCNTEKTVYCVELATGEVLWNVPGGLHSTVTVEGDVMVVLSESAAEGLSAYRISPQKAERLWKVDLVDRGSSPIIANGCVYAYGKGKVLCVKLADGAKVWEQNVGGGEITPLVLVGDRLLAYAGGGRLMMLDAAPDKGGQILARAKVDLPIATSPTIANGRMYIRTETALVCYDLTGAK